MNSTLAVAAGPEYQGSSPTELTTALQRYRQALVAHPDFELGFGLTAPVGGLVPAMASAWPLAPSEDDCLLTIWRGIADAISAQDGMTADKLLYLAVSLTPETLPFSETAWLLDMDEGGIWAVTNAQNCTGKHGVWLQYQLLDADTATVEKAERKELEATLSQNETALRQWQKTFHSTIVQAQFDAATNMEAQTALCGLLSQSTALASALHQQAQLNKQSKKSSPAELVQIVRQTRHALAAQVINPKLPEPVRHQLRQALQSLDKIMVADTVQKIAAHRTEVTALSPRTSGVEKPQLVQVHGVAIPPLKTRQPHRNNERITPAVVAPAMRQAVHQLGKRPLTVLKPDNDTSRLMLVPPSKLKPSHTATVSAQSLALKSISSREPRVAVAAQPAQKGRPTPSKAQQLTKQVAAPQTQTRSTSVKIITPNKTSSQTVLPLRTQLQPDRKSKTAIVSPVVTQAALPRTAVHVEKRPAASSLAPVQKAATQTRATVQVAVATFPVSAVRAGALGPAVTQQELATLAPKLATFVPVGIVPKVEATPQSNPLSNQTITNATSTRHDAPLPARHSQASVTDAPIVSAQPDRAVPASPATTKKNAGRATEQAYSQPTQARTFNEAPAAGEPVTGSGQTAFAGRPPETPARTHEASRVSDTAAFGKQRAANTKPSSGQTARTEKPVETRADVSSWHPDTPKQDGQQPSQRNEQQARPEQQTVRPAAEQATDRNQGKQSADRSPVSSDQPPPSFASDNQRQSQPNQPQQAADAAYQDRKENHAAPLEPQQSETIAAQVFTKVAETVDQARQSIGTAFVTVKNALCTGGAGCVFCSASKVAEMGQKSVDWLGKVGVTMEIFGLKQSKEQKLEVAASGKAKASFAARRSPLKPAT